MRKMFIAVLKGKGTEKKAREARQEKAENARLDALHANTEATKRNTEASKAVIDALKNLPPVPDFRSRKEI